MPSKRLKLFAEDALMLSSIGLVVFIGLNILSNMEVQIMYNTDYSYNVTESITVLSDPPFINYFFVIIGAMCVLCLCYFFCKPKNGGGVVEA